MTNFDQGKAFLAAHDYHVRVYSGNPDRFELWADGDRQAAGTSWDEMEQATDKYLTTIQGETIGTDRLMS